MNQDRNNNFLRALKDLIEDYFEEIKVSMTLLNKKR